VDALNSSAAAVSATSHTRINPMTSGFDPAWKGGRVERIGEATLYLGDCREILPTLGKVDAVVTDVPYETAWIDNGLRTVRYGAWQDTTAGIDFLSFVQGAPTILCWCGWEQLTEMRDALPGRTLRLMGWKKTAPSPMNGQYYFTAGFEVGLYGKLPAAWYRGDVKPSIWEGPPPRGDEREHPTQKPVPLMVWCVESVAPEGGVVLDPFMGSGTTGVACAKLDRAFIGIEREPSYFDIAVRRIEEAYKQPRLFAEPVAKPEQFLMEGLAP
jgi:site-specific DNA-methyltransferase (adenine-specific)